jgi:hypothetical protein
LKVGLRNRFIRNLSSYHHSTLNAACRRRGQYNNLNVRDIIFDTIKQELIDCLNIYSLKLTADTTNQRQYKGELLNSLIDNLESAKRARLEDWERLQSDINVWDICVSFWGKGLKNPGYTVRVCREIGNSLQFDDIQTIAKEWLDSAQAMEDITTLLEQLDISEPTTSEDSIDCSDDESSWEYESDTKDKVKGAATEPKKLLPYRIQYEYFIEDDSAEPEDLMDFEEALSELEIDYDFSSFWFLGSLCEFTKKLDGRQVENAERILIHRPGTQSSQYLASLQKRYS